MGPRFCIEQQLPRHAEMEDEHASIKFQNNVFSVPPHVHDLAAAERIAECALVISEHEWRKDFDELYVSALEARGDVANDRFDFGKLGHQGTSMNTSPRSMRTGRVASRKDALQSYSPVRQSNSHACQGHTTVCS